MSCDLLEILTIFCPSKNILFFEHRLVVIMTAMEHVCLSVLLKSSTILVPFNLSLILTSGLLKEDSVLRSAQVCDCSEVCMCNLTLRSYETLWSMTLVDIKVI